MSTRHSHIPQRAIAAADRGNLIEAIRIIRAEQGLDLKDAKAAVDHHLRNRVLLQGNNPAVQRTTSSNTQLFAVLALITACIAAYLHYTGKG